MHWKIQACIWMKFRIGWLRSERGITVPGEMKVAGMGHGAIADLLCPRLTTVHYHYHTSGREAADLLLDLMEKKRRQHESRMLKYEVIRQKTI